ncbi:MAG TPA: LacI family DNA-binding transcriptional regulator [Bacteroidales bacterium]|jgi:LacI family transcriptional regulator|nr:LacI family DNA-binding transcriptional regulator [Bacteroidales bacterium]
MGKKLKNKDLAAKLGVSSTLVSLVLNNKADQHGIKKETQERVLALARQMGYFDLLKEKNETSPVEEKPGVIGMIIPDHPDPFIYQITPYLQKAFSSIGIGFSIITKDNDERRYSRFINSFRKFFTGLILVGDAADETTVRSLRSSGYPFVLLEKSLKALPLNSVCSDMMEGARRVADHIELLGYRNIVILTGNLNSPAANLPVLEAITKTIEARQNLNKPIIVEVENLDVDMDLDFSLIEKYLRPPFSTEILIIIKAEHVYPVYYLFRKKKLRIPHDIALISMEDGIEFDLMYTPVTSLRKPYSAMALKIANMIWAEIRSSGKGKYKRQVNMSPELIVRKSCGTI